MSVPTLQQLTVVEGNPLFLKGHALEPWILDAWQRQAGLSEKTLVIVRHTHEEKALQNALCQGWSAPLHRLPVYTFNGLIRHIVQRLWPFAELKLQEAFPQSLKWAQWQADLVGLEESERLFQLILSTQKETEAYQNLKLDEASLIRQLIRRQRLRAEQRLTRVQMQAMDTVLNLPNREWIHRLEQHFDQQSLALRYLDSTKQIDVALGLLEANPEYFQYLELQPDLLLWTDADESTPAEQALIRILSSHAQAIHVTWDARGGARRGYLNADIEGAKALIEAWKNQAQELCLLQDSSKETSPRALGDLLCDVLVGEPLPMDALAESTPRLNLHAPQRSLIEMWQAVTELLTTLPPEKVLIVLPELNALTLSPLRAFFQAQGISFQILSGTQRPVDLWQGRVFLLLIQCLRSHEWGLPLSRFEWRNLFTTCLNLHQYDAQTLDAFSDFVTQQAMQALAQGKAGHASLPLEIPEDLLTHPSSRERYQTFRDALADLADASVEAQLLAISQRWIYPHLQEGEADTALQLIFRSWQRHRDMLTRLNQPLEEGGRQWLWQAKYGQVADTADSPKALNPVALWVASPQKVVDFKLQRPYQLWLDVQNPRWSKTDEAPLYHTALHSPQGWQRIEQAKEENHTLDLLSLTERQRRERAGHLLRKVVFAAGQALHIFSSELDLEGREYSHQHPLLYQALTQNLSPLLEKPQLNAIALAPLRADQEAVLTYSGGTMAISAVPGAGKTFVTVELILSLIKKGRPPSEILVLTYMESAARTLLNRLKPKLTAAGMTQMPMVCTIHALAFKILSEPAHARHIGLDANTFRMIDEIEADALQKQAAIEVYPLASTQEDLSVEAWQRILIQAIRHAKSLELTWVDLLEDAETLNNTRLKAMGLGMKAYQHSLETRNALDFTDLIVYAVQLLDAHPDIRAFYQAQYQVIIEDEAQDSSQLLQRFLNLLGGDSPHLVRCGDTNQSITTTFSSAEPEVFRSFMAQAETHVRMTQSSRCAVEIMQVANQWIQHTQQKGHPLAEAFLPACMEGVATLNPPLAEPLRAEVFSSQVEEMQALIASVLEIQARYPHARCAILLRYNRDVLTVSQQLLECGIPALSMTERLSSLQVFKLVEAWLGVLLYGETAHARLAWLYALKEAHVYDLHTLEDASFTALRDVLASLPLFALPLIEVTTLPMALQNLYRDWHHFQHEFLQRDLPSCLLDLVKHYMPSVLDQCNGVLCALHAQRILQRYGWERAPLEAVQLNLLNTFHAVSPLEVVHQHFKTLTTSRRNVQLFTEELLNPPPVSGQGLETPPLQVMTLHKSKGMEFDFVWMPALTQAHFPDHLEQIRIGDTEKALIGIQRLAKQRHHPQVPLAPLAADIEAFKRQHLEEEARLLYVGLTRAMKGLFLSAHLQYRNAFHRLQKTQPTEAFTLIQAWLKSPSGRPL
jgi:DNA helicase-2/ATP-dependent DNA helicase PcrA